MNQQIFLISLLHIFVISPYMLFICYKNKSLDPINYNILIGLGIYVVLFHGYKLYQNLSKHKSIWINLLHIFFIAPLIVYIGIKKQNTQSIMYWLLSIIAIFAIIIHIYWIYEGMK